MRDAAGPGFASSSLCSSMKLTSQAGNRAGLPDQGTLGHRILTLGITGYGRLAREYYVPALARMKDLRIASVADPFEASRLAASKRLPQVHTYPSHQQMLSHENLDAVLIASPPFSPLTA